MTTIQTVKRTVQGVLLVLVVVSGLEDFLLQACLPIGPGTDFDCRRQPGDAFSVKCFMERLDGGENRVKISFNVRAVGMKLDPEPSLSDDLVRPHDLPAHGHAHANRNDLNLSKGFQR